MQMRGRSSLRSLDCLHRPVEDPILTDRFIVILPQAVEMHRKEQIGRGFKKVQLLLQQHCIGAKRYILLSRHQTFDDLAYLLVQQRLAARNRHHRSAAFLSRGNAIFNAQPFIQNLIGIVDFAASGSGKIAPE